MFTYFWIKYLFEIKLKFTANLFFLNSKNIIMCFLVNSGSRFSELTGDMCVLSHFSCVPLFETVAHQVPLCPWDSPGKNTGVGCHAFLQGIFRIHGMGLCLLCLLHWQEGSFPLVTTWKLHWGQAGPTEASPVAYLVKNLPTM